MLFKHNIECSCSDDVAIRITRKFYMHLPLWREENCIVNQEERSKILLIFSLCWSLMWLDFTLLHVANYACLMAKLLLVMVYLRSKFFSIWGSLIYPCTCGSVNFYIHLACRTLPHNCLMLLWCTSFSHLGIFTLFNIYVKLLQSRDGWPFLLEFDT